MSEKDFLTGCLSKESINPALDKIRAECKIRKIPFSVLLIDLDHFKAFNDKYGHIDGDEVLKYFASTLRLSFEEEGISIFRFGGDEFVIVFAGKSGKEAHSIASNVMKNLKIRPFLFKGRIFRLNFSAGIASYPSDGNEVETIVQKADRAMYFSKTHGRGQITLYGHMLWRAVERILSVLIGVLFVAGTLFYFKNSFCKDYVVGWVRREVSKATTTLTPISAKIDNEVIDLIYLKSGRILKGTIIREGEDDAELDLSLERGKGSVTIRKSDIKKIRRRLKKANQYQ